MRGVGGHIKEAPTSTGFGSPGYFFTHAGASPASLNPHD